MTNRYAWGLSGMAIALSIALSGVAFLQAQDVRTVQFNGAINDYSPSTVAVGPYEIRGLWSLDVQAGTGTFSADLTMETSDYGTSNATAVDPANPATRSPHTHHISITNATVSYDTSVCPANSPPTTGSGVVLTAGTATTAANGGPAPFDPKNTSTLQICITGAAAVQFSNLTMVYTGPATAHFGPQPIHGVVRQVSTN